MCDLEQDLSLIILDQLDVKKGHFKLKLHIDNFHKNVNIKINKSIEGKFIDIIFDFKNLQNIHIYEDLYLKEIMKKIKKVKRNYKYSILKIYKDFDDILMSEEIKSIKITSHNIINSINNIEYLERTNLDGYSTEDKLLLKYEK